MPNRISDTSSTRSAREVIHTLLSAAIVAVLVSLPGTAAGMATGDVAENGTESVTDKVVESVSAPPSGGSAVVPEAGTVTDLGPAFSMVNIRQVEFGELPDGRPVAYAISNGDPASFNVIDAHTGERVHAEPLTGYELGSWLEIAPDGTVYFSVRTPTPAAMFRFDPGTMHVEHIADGVAGETALYSAAFDADGVLYFGTYPHAKLVSFVPATDTFRDYGSLTTDAAYVFSVGVVGDEVWAGTGPVPHLYRVDPLSGERQEMDVPDHLLENTDWFISIERRDDLVFVRLSPRGTYDLAVYDLREGRWLDEVIENTFAADPTDTGRTGEVYLLAGRTLVGYNVRTRRPFSTGFDDTDLPAALAGAVGTYGITTLGDRPRQITVAGLTTDGDLWHFDPATKRTAIVGAEVLGSSAGAHSMGVGPDGSVYLGAYLSSGLMSRIDRTGDEIEQLRGPKQGDAIITHGEEIVVSSYPGAVVHAGVLTEPWAWEVNPRKIVEIGRGEPHFQDRIFAMASAGDRVALGSVPDYGRLGGALSFLDTETGDVAVHRDVVAEQSVVSLAHRDGTVFGGTSIHGGLSSTPSRSTAELFMWDVGSGELAWSGPVVPGATIIHQLEFGDDGMLWGMADDGTVFEFDPATRTVRRSFDSGLGNGNVWGRLTSLYLRQADGLFYGNAGGRLFRFDPATLDLEILVDGGVRQSAMAANGAIYFAGDVNVHRFQPAPTN